MLNKLILHSPFGSLYAVFCKFLHFEMTNFPIKRAYQLPAPLSGSATACISKYEIYMYMYTCEIFTYLYHSMYMYFMLPFEIILSSSIVFFTSTYMYRSYFFMILTNIHSFNSLSFSFRFMAYLKLIILMSMKIFTTTL